MNKPGATRYDKSMSPVGWYVASYVLRFVELGEPQRDNNGHDFLIWENTILVKASNIREAYDRAVVLAERSTNPYKGGEEGVDVQWVFEGITELLPVYEEIGDGGEIMWAESEESLEALRKRLRSRDEICERLST